MIINFEEFLHRSQSMRIDICVVGGGGTGLEIAAALGKSARRIVIFERGGARLDPREARLSRVHATARALPTGVAALGSGEWRMPDPIELEARPWINAAKWPVGFSDLAPFLQEVAEDARVPFQQLESAPVRSEIVSESGLSTTRCFAPRGSASNRRAKNHAVVEQSRTITLVQGASVVEMYPAPGGASVSEVLVKSIHGGSARVPVVHVVVAAGAIESARLLMASTRFGRNGAGSVAGLAGRGLMHAMRVALGSFVPTNTAAKAGFLDSARLAAKHIHTRLVLTAARQRVLETGNHAIAFEKTDESGGLIAGLLRKREPLDAFLHIEPSPALESHVALDPEQDELGMPLAEVHWQPGAQTEEGVRRTVVAMMTALGQGYGTLEVVDSAFDPANWKPTGRPIGTARMGLTEKEGVVDRDCRVFGIKNLHVAGGAVVPAAGHGDATLIKTALARRLARHLSALTQSP